MAPMRANIIFGQMRLGPICHWSPLILGAIGARWPLGSLILGASCAEHRLEEVLAARIVGTHWGPLALGVSS